MLNKINKLLNDYNYNQDSKDSFDSFDFQGAYRNVICFNFNKRKYVLKIDYWPEATKNNAGCYSEARCWNMYKNTKEGKMLAPVIVYGLDDEGVSWLVMPKLCTIDDILIRRSSKSKENFLRRKILPEFRKIVDARWMADRISCPEFGDDLHYCNWGMDNRGNWFLFDYSIGGIRECWFYEG